jgi:DNA-binding CsgD family transcriptional regulator
MLSERVRLADLLAAVSVATDLGNGQEPEKAIRACLVATALARRMGTPEAEVSDVYYTALLRHLGCTATAHEEAWLVGDELAVRPAAERADFGNPREAFALLLLAGRGTGAGRVRHLVRSLRSGRKGDQAILGAVCEVGARLAERLGLGPGVRDGLSQSFERWDGTGVPGYHRGTSGAQVPAAARVLAAADALQAMTQDRPHRRGLAPEAAAAALAEEARAGRLDPECVRAVVEAAGQPPPTVRTVWPAGLSDREVEVLRLVARGLSNRAIAERLSVSPRTAEHHVQHIYTKIGASTRAAAAMFAMEHGLLTD